MFTLLICQAFSWGICNAYQRFDYPTEVHCYRAAEFYMKTAVKKPESIICVPKIEEKK